jgi:tripartite-type tricarboxylate transporter receptor subunit TctC
MRVLVAGLAALAAPAFAQTAYPNKPVRMVLGFGAGGSTDLLFRVIADDMSRRLGQPMIVENRPGAGGVLAANAVKQAAADGYTIWAGGAMPFSPVMMKDNPVNMSRELAPISLVAYGDWVMYVPSAMGINTMRELLQYAKSNPQKFRFATISPFNTMIMAMVEKQTGVKAELILYKTTDQSIQALLTGDSEVTINAVGGFTSFVQSGKLKPVAVFSPTRTDAYKDTGTAIEQGVQVNTRFSHQMWGTQGTPREAINRLNAALADTLRNSAVVDRIKVTSLVPAHSTPEELVAAYDAELKLFSDTAEQIGFKPQ